MPVNKRSCVWAGLIAAGLAVSTAQAITLPTNVITVSASTGGLNGSVDIDISDATVFGDALQWVAASNIDIMDGGAVVGTINQGTSIVMGLVPTPPAGDASIRMTFNVMANNNADTVFSISSGSLTNLGFTNADALATGGITVTDSNNNGAELTALNSGGSRFADFGYNNGLLFASLIDGSSPTDPDVGNLSAGIGGSNSDSEDVAGPGVFLPIGAVSEMNIQFDFRLTAGDQASGTAFFVVVPAPASAALLGLGGLVAARRRR
ncbi:MAG: PEP-CTERM sorting domain-containing protein [Phycisphaerales bacterium]